MEGVGKGLCSAVDLQWLMMILGNYLLLISLSVFPQSVSLFFHTDKYTHTHTHIYIIIIIIISHCKSTAERKPFTTPSITAYLVLFFARLLLQIFQSRPPILYLVFSYFVSHYMNASRLVPSSIDYCSS